MKINGNNFGLYEVLEDISDAFLKRNYGQTDPLFKPESEGIALSPEDIEAIRNGKPIPMGTANGADMNYTDEKIESYSDIFDNVETEAEEKDQRKVIEALKAVHNNSELDKYLDIDELTKYYAAQVFLLNYDSYIGPMLHNYYLLLNKERLSLLPWDYNLAFATMALMISEEDYEDPTRLINNGVDTPLYMTSEEMRPMWTWIIRDQEYLKKYHEAFESILDYIESEAFEEEADRIHELLKPYVQNDQACVVSVERYEKAQEALKAYCFTRAQSIRKQLDGGLSTESDKQSEADRIDASKIRLLDMNAEQSLE